MRDLGNSFYALRGDKIQDIPNTRNSRHNGTNYNSRNRGTVLSKISDRNEKFRYHQK